MIGIVVCVSDEVIYRQSLLRGLAGQKYSDYVVVELRNQSDIHNAYNLALDNLAAQEVDTAVLVHQDVEFQDPGLLLTLREILRDPSIAIVGPVGARNVQTLSWWNGVVRGEVKDPFRTISTPEPFGDVDVLDGMFLGMSRWGVENLRFDPLYGGFHGYDGDICFEARSRHKRVVTAPLPIFHRSKSGYGNASAFAMATQHFREKWIHSGRLDLPRFAILPTSKAQGSFLLVPPSYEGIYLDELKHISSELYAGFLIPNAKALFAEHGMGEVLEKLKRRESTTLEIWFENSDPPSGGTSSIGLGKLQELCPPRAGFEKKWSIETAWSQRGVEKVILSLSPSRHQMSIVDTYSLSA